MVEQATSPVSGPVVGIIGLGAMGAPVVHHLREAGITVRVHDLDGDALARAEALGAVACGSSRETAAQCEKYVGIRRILCDDESILVEQRVPVPGIGTGLGGRTQSIAISARYDAMPLKPAPSTGSR